MISVAKAYGLNLKHAKFFNLATINGHFDLLEKVISTYNIQQRNCFNVDEKGLQLGGGPKCKGNPRVLWRSHNHTG
jgi:hypothetical protein